MAMYPPEVERWRAKVRQVFGPENEDKWLYLINGESGGDFQSVGDEGIAYGLFQSHYIQPGTSVDEQFRDAKRLYDSDISRGGSGFRDWGEGTEKYDHPYNPETGTGYFGALGHKPYPGNQALNARGPLDAGDVTSPQGTTFKDTVLNRTPRQGRSINDILAERRGSGGSSKQTIPFAENASLNWSMSPRNQQAPFAASRIPSGKITLSQPSPLGAYANLLSGDFDTTYTGLMTKYLNLYEQIAMLGQEDMSPGADGSPIPTSEKAVQLFTQLKGIETAMTMLEKAREMGLVTTGVDAAKSFIETETGKQTTQDKAYKDYVSRVGDMTALGQLGTQAFTTASQNIGNSTKANAERFAAVESGLPRTTPMSISRQGQGMNLQPYIDSIRATIPAQAPVGYNPGTSIYDRLQGEIEKRRQLGSQQPMYSSPVYNPQTPFGV